MTLASLFFFIFGLFLLVSGAELLVRYSSKLAIYIGISPLVVGLTIVAFGTSAPELFVSVQATLDGSSNLALGNIVGSNLCNILFILGASAVFAPLVVHQQLIKKDIPLLVVLSVIVYGMSFNGSINFIEGVLLFAGVLAYTSFAIIMSRKENKQVTDEYTESLSKKSLFSSLWLSILFILIGLGMLVLGSNYLVESATMMAEYLGVGKEVIGLTIFAFGTSLPEAVTSIMASIKGERDIAVGNAIGSCIFNLLAVLGATAIAAPDGVEVTLQMLQFDIPCMIVASIICIPLFISGKKVSRGEGVLLLGLYILYLYQIIERHSEIIG